MGGDPVLFKSPSSEMRKAQHQAWPGHTKLRGIMKRLKNELLNYESSVNIIYIILYSFMLYYDISCNKCVCQIPVFGAWWYHLTQHTELLRSVQPCKEDDQIAASSEGD